MNQSLSLAKSIAAELAARQQTRQWETFILSMLTRLELDPSERSRAEAHYQVMARHIASKLGIGDNDVHVVIQGSMRTQTTISPRGNAKFDLDVAVKLTGSRFDNIQAETFFEEFGKALKGLPEAAGEPEARRRCWRLQYPGEPFYFDVTPAIPGSLEITGTDLRVRDPDTVWSPSNPEDFADWFCTIAQLRFAFQQGGGRVVAMDGRSQVDPLPNRAISLDDVLRRTVQLIKLHRDNHSHLLPAERKDAMPISVILVTLAGHVYRELHASRPNGFSSPIELALEVVDQLPRYIDRSKGNYRVPNPGLAHENFADRWNHDGGARASEFSHWHARLKDDLALLFHEDYDSRSAERIRSVFGQAGVDAWKASLPASNDVLKGLRATVPVQPRDPSSPTPMGSRKTLA
jgi:hypothetical protein